MNIVEIITIFLALFSATAIFVLSTTNGQNNDEVGNLLPIILIVSIIFGGVVIGEVLTEKKFVASREVVYFQEIKVSNDVAVVTKEGKIRLVPDGYIVISDGGNFYLVKN